MTKQLNPDTLRAACGDDASDAGISIDADLEPLAGRHAPVKPSTYAGRVLQEDRRWWGEPPAQTEVVVLDNVPSEANRLEAELLRLRSTLGLPELVLDLSAIETLPPHLPRHLSSFRWPHRIADAYLRDSLDGGTSMSKSTLGRELLNATAATPQAILGWFPQAALFGMWQSHLGSKRSQAKVARSWVSEILGYGPATTEGSRTRTLGLKGDDLNLSISEQVKFDELDHLSAPWTVDEGVLKKERATTGQSRKALSEIGHGQVPFKAAEAALSGISFLAIEQHATVSFAGLRRLNFGDSDRNAVARALLVSLGLVAHVAAFGRGFMLRSGCDLRPVVTRWQWVGDTSSEEINAPVLEDAVALFTACRDAADSAGLLTGGGWGAQPRRLTPADNLQNMIRKSWSLPPLGE